MKEKSTVLILLKKNTTFTFESLKNIFMDGQNMKLIKYIDRDYYYYYYYYYIFIFLASFSVSFSSN